MTTNSHQLKFFTTSPTPIIFNGGQVTVWLGASMSGKSTAMYQIVADLARQGKRSFSAFLEDKNPETAMRRILLEHTKTKDRKVLEDAFGQLSPYVVMMEAAGAATVSNLMESMEMAQRDLAAEVFIIDSMTRLFGLFGDPSEQARFLEKTKAFAEATNSHVHLVRHDEPQDDKGSSVWQDLADNLIRVERGRLSVLKHRDSGWTGILPGVVASPMFR